MIKRTLRRWLGIHALELENKRLREHLVAVQDRVDYRFEELDKLTAMDVDVGLRGPCSIILSGVYRGRGYVKFYEMAHAEFQHMVRDFQQSRSRNLLRNLDDVSRMYSGSFAL